MVAKSDKLSKKETGFVKDWIKTGNGTKSVLNNYDTDDENVASVIASQNLGKLKIQKAIMKYADRFKDDDIFEKHQALLNKEEVVVRNNVTSGEIEVIPTGQIDVQAVKAGLEMIYKIKGSYVPEKEALPTENKTYNFYFTPEFQQNIKGYEDNLKKQILNAQKTKTVAQDVEVIE